MKYANQYFRNADLVLTLSGAAKKNGRKIKEMDLGFMSKGSIWCENGKIVWIGKDKNLPLALVKKKSVEYNLKGMTVLPGFVECHTHSVFAGHRADEFEMRQNGRSYSEIAAGGGGILSTVKAVRKAKNLDLLNQAQQRVDQFKQQGVTTLEIKSGYGLNLRSEIKMLSVIKKLNGVRITSTFLGAHALPPEYKSYERYLADLGQSYLPLIKKRKLADRVDVFIEKGFFESVAVSNFLQIAKNLGFAVTLHADQLSLSGGTELAVDFHADSADHVICVGDRQIQKLANSQTVAVLLPAADLYLKCAYPPARKMIDAGACVALATDFNPGTSPTQNLNLVGLLARLNMQMTLPEVICAYTYGAARALRMENLCGSLEVGKSADFICTKKDWSELFYSVGARDIDATYISGKLSAAL
jgi:imidazolonepropionase